MRVSFRTGGKKNFFLGLGLTVLLSFPTTAFSSRPVELDKGMSDLSQQLAQSMLQEKKNRLAVLPFQNLDGRMTDLGKYISEELTTKLFLTQKFQVVERNMISKVLDELAFGESDIIDAKSAQKIGNLLGVEAIVTGTITDLDDHLAVNARILDVGKATVISVAQTKIKKDANVTKLFQKSSSKGSGGKAAETLVTDLMRDFSTQQGVNGWRYLAYEPKRGFWELRYGKVKYPSGTEGNAWDPNPDKFETDSWCDRTPRISLSGQTIDIHPGCGIFSAAAYNFQENGYYHVVGKFITYKNPPESNSDGVGFSIRQDERIIFSQIVPDLKMDNVNVPFDLRIEVRSGSRLYFMCDPLGNHGWDWAAIESLKIYQ